MIKDDDHLRLHLCDNVLYTCANDDAIDQTKPWTFLSREISLVNVALCRQRWEMSQSGNARMSTATSSSQMSNASAGVIDGLRDRRREYEAACILREDTKGIAARLRAIGQQGELLADGAVGSFSECSRLARRPF